jgi:lipoprotein-anchoring transpeptidase ErfK/SrfK
LASNVGRLNQFGNFYPFPAGTEIIFDGKVFMPPIGTVQRRIPDALGPYKLDTGDGYLIHGTHIFNEDSIGQAVSHGCVRMTNEDLERLYPLVPVGTPVFIF